MCKKCQKYRHVQAQCPNRKYICGLCAEEHPTWECPHKQSRDYTPKCANCKGPHKAASDSCLIRKDEIARTRQAILMSGSEHRVPHSSTSPGSSSSSSFRTSSSTSSSTSPSSASAQILALIPEAPLRTATRAKEPTKAIPMKPIDTIKKRPRGRPPKSKSSNDEQEPEPHYYIGTALTASKPNLPTTIDPVLLDNSRYISSTAPAPVLCALPKATRSRGPCDSRTCHIGIAP
uniref:Nucleic-acid-binding protein from transposon X-element n=1 Tax=Talaromyces marneffei PM1 TaxID=1077442 RepID=A0A093X6B4_TALMA